MTTVSVVIPCRNEERNIPHVLSSMPSVVTEVIVVDGDSKDRTIDVAVRARSDVKILAQPGSGKGAATIAGLKAATGEIVVLLDGDDSMDAHEIDRMVARLVAGADVVHASRAIAGGGSEDFTLIRRSGNTVLKQLVNLLYGVAWTDLTYGYVAMWSDVVTDLDLATIINDCAESAGDVSGRSDSRPRAYGHGFEVEVLILCRAVRRGLEVGETPSFERKRRHGTSNLHAAKDGLRVLGAVVRERVSPPVAGRVATTLAERQRGRLGTSGT